MIQIYLLPLSLAYQQERHLRPLIPPLQLQHWQRRRQHADQLRSILAHAAVRLYLAERLDCSALDVRFQVQAHGKPVLSHPEASPWHFNISHSGQWVAVALAHYPIGVDIELHQGPAPKALTDSCFTPDEQANLHTEADFYHAWSRKEAALKAVGSGFSISPLELEVLPYSDQQLHSAHPELQGLHIGSTVWDQHYSLAWCGPCKADPVFYQLSDLPELQKHTNSNGKTDNSTNLCNSSHYHDQDNNA